MAKHRKSRSPLPPWMRWLPVLAALALFVYWGNTDIQTDEAVYTSPALPAAFDGLRIVQLSDLHSREFGAGQRSGCTAPWSDAAPDVIFLTGDLVDEYAVEPVPYARTGGRGSQRHRPYLLRHRQPRVGSWQRRGGRVENRPAAGRCHGAQQ